MGGDKVFDKVADKVEARREKKKAGFYPGLFATQLTMITLR